jgi:hypothetical protein
MIIDQINISELIFPNNDPLRHFLYENLQRVSLAPFIKDLGCSIAMPFSQYKFVGWQSSLFIGFKWAAIIFPFMLIGSQVIISISDTKNIPITGN